MNTPETNTRQPAMEETDDSSEGPDSPITLPELKLPNQVKGMWEYDFWNSRPWLSYLHATALASRIAPESLFGAVIARANAMYPPSIVLKVTPWDEPMSRNLNVALVGGPGSTKGKSIGRARTLIPKPVENPMRELKPKTGEALVSAFVDMEQSTDEEGKPLKGEFEPHVLTDRAQIVLPEVTALATALHRRDSTMLDTLLSAFSNEPLGGDTRNKQSRVTLPSYMYGISSVVGMQPACSGAVFDNTASGFAGRFLFYLAVMPDPPESKTDSPAGRFPFNPLNIPPNNGFDKVKHLFEAGSREALPPTTSYPLTVMTFPECAQEYADQQQVRGLKGQANALDSHRVELASKLAALFCLMDQREGPRQFLVTDEDWQLGLYALAISDRARSFCMSEALDSRRTHGTEYAKDRLIASTKAKADVDRLKAETPGKITQFFNRRKQQQQGDQFTGIQISRGVNANWRPFVYESITTMNDQGLLVCADNTGSVPTSIWLLAP